MFVTEKWQDKLAGEKTVYWLRNQCFSGIRKWEDSKKQIGCIHSHTQTIRTVSAFWLSMGHGHFCVFQSWVFRPAFSSVTYRQSRIFHSCVFSRPIRSVLVFGLDNTATHSFVLRMRGRVLTSDWKGLRTPSRCLKSMSLYKIIYYQTDKFRY